MTDSLRIPIEGGDPIKLLRNTNRSGVILRQGPVAIFVDIEVADLVIDALCSLVDEIESTS